ncbi:P-loop containing nucleoside triphosphate hydrolase protein [Fomitopsis serialis]|uniref:P-loop containing nucleoside triphosphate hydrolase protein n=1 Tax=Fomitopsis serialis TaxID=139415 RepID=UPI0020080ACD|nr:P-loop containing nucleoside triphosphate hydrolase protein [Neoantrodia serialis]KAH9911186.1 P-loop containing nucleoside triphosphate hydrolase protein [Neoantrodia serialis]
MIFRRSTTHRSFHTVISVIRMIKLFGWESRVSQQIAEKRHDELEAVKKSRMWELANSNVNLVIPLLTMIVTFSTYTLIMKHELTASTVFSSITVFGMLGMHLRMAFNMIPGIMQAKVSLDRLDNFLRNQLSSSQHPESRDTIGFRDATFTWTNDISGPEITGLESGRRRFSLHIDGEVSFEHGCITLIVGPTGSGKTSMLMALLGEMHYVPSGPSSFYNLPRAGGVAYAAQESWVQNETIKDNILFGSPYSEERYQRVIYQCGLERDIDLFEAGDMTEVGEKGITLRITLARAVYSSAEILLLDDVLAALDVHTSQWIINKCLRGDLMENRTVIMVTHNVAIASTVAQFKVTLGPGGRVSSQELIQDIRGQTQALGMGQDSQEQGYKQGGDQRPEGLVKSSGKLVIAEEIAVGRVGWGALKLFLARIGGQHQIFFWSFCLLTLIASELLANLQVWFLGYWARQYEQRPASEVKASYYLGFYAGMIVVSVAFYCISLTSYWLGTIRGGRSIHESLISSVLGTTLRWLDRTPASRIIARCTQDIQSVDGEISKTWGVIMELNISMLIKVVAVVIMSPIFLVVAVAVAIAGGLVGQIYMKAQLTVKREMSVAKAPVLGHFGAAFAGLVSIRAYGAQDAFKEVSYQRIDRYTRAARTFWDLTRWVAVRIEMLSAIFVSSLAAYLLYARGTTASDTGFSLNMAVGFSGYILYWVRVWNDFEIAVIFCSLERIKQYVEIEQEPKPTQDGTPPAYWPASGDLKVEKLSARYSEDGPLVLKEISFELKSGERVGIVGRTGSGKSSLALSLLRCILSEGKVYFDGLATDTINLDALRSSITIIPQMPELLSGTLRRNLDPLGQHGDPLLNDALRSAGLFALQEGSRENHITLDTQIASGGANLSVGQRQILALARAIVRQSKLLILDEAHRLHTVMDADKIMVLDAGRMAEFGKPSELLKNHKGMLRALVEESGDARALSISQDYSNFTAIVRLLKLKTL